MEIKCKFVELLLIGILFVQLSCGSAEQDIQKSWCDGVTVNTYIRNVSDCRIWIRCNGQNSPTSGYCPNPSYFSLELQRCTLESVADCFVCQNTTSISFEAIENSCNRYIRCIEGVPSEITCEAGLVFNPKTEKCDWEYNAACNVSKYCNLTKIKGF